MELVGTDSPCHDVDMATRDLERLAKHVKAHRMELFTSRKAAAGAVGISKDTWRRVEEGKVVRESTYAKVDRALGWGTGSCLAIADDGAEPVLVDATEGAAGAGARPAMPAEAVRRAAFEAARSRLPTVSIGDVDAFTDELVEVLRRIGEVSDGE